MSSQSPAPTEPKEEVKEEDSIVAEGSATDAPEASEAPAGATSTGGGLSKKDFEIMTGILHRITNYRDQECVCELLHLPLKLITL